MDASKGYAGLAVPASIRLRSRMGRAEGKKLRVLKAAVEHLRR